jgi:hypothetical protein
MKIEGSGSESGSISQSHGSADPDPHQNVMDPQHCFNLILEPYDFYVFQIIFKAYCTALARQAAPNFIRILLGWDGLGVTSFLLVVYYQREKSFNTHSLSKFI